jgi:hypothetical protein
MHKMQHRIKNLESNVFITFITDSINLLQFGKKTVSFCLDQIQSVYTTAPLDQWIL